MTRPPTVVAVTTDRRERGPPPKASGRIRPARPEVHLKEGLVDRLRAVGAQVVLLPPTDDDPDPIIRWALAHTHAIVISGGAFDIHPSHYGESVHARVDHIDEGRSALEMGLARACIATGFPTLGICGGMQALAVAGGGTLVQDIATAFPDALAHEQPNDPAEPSHPVHLVPSQLATAHGCLRIDVNSTHHQSIAKAGPFTVVGRAPDGVVEAIELQSHPLCLGVQWHPELISHVEFRLLVKTAARLAAI